MTLVSSPEQITDTFMGHPRVDRASEGELPEIRFDPKLRNPGMVPVNRGPIYNRHLSAAGWSPVTLGKVVQPPKWSDRYMVLWMQEGEGEQPITLVKDFEPRPTLLPQ